MDMMGVGVLVQKELNMGKGGTITMSRGSERESGLFPSDSMIFEALGIDAITDF